MKWKNSLIFCYELLCFALSDIKKYHKLTFNGNHTSYFIGDFWLRKTARQIYEGQYNYCKKQNNFSSDLFLDDPSYVKRKALKILVIQNAFVILFRLSLFKHSVSKTIFFPNKGANFLK